MKSASFPVIPAVLKGSRKPVLLEAIEGGFIHYFYTYTHTCTHTYTWIYTHMYRYSLAYYSATSQIHCSLKIS
jgi:hypothetical protein